MIVVRKDGTYANATQLSDFAGARITGQQNTFHYTVIDQIEGVQKMTAMESFPSMIVLRRMRRSMDTSPNVPARNPRARQTPI